MLKIADPNQWKNAHIGPYPQSRRSARDIPSFDERTIKQKDALSS